MVLTQFLPGVVEEVRFYQSAALMKSFPSSAVRFFILSFFHVEDFQIKYFKAKHVLLILLRQKQSDGVKCCVQIYLRVHEKCELNYSSISLHLYPKYYMYDSFNVTKTGPLLLINVLAMGLGS